MKLFIYFILFFLCVSTVYAENSLYLSSKFSLIKLTFDENCQDFNNCSNIEYESISKTNGRNAVIIRNSQKYNDGYRFNAKGYTYEITGNFMDSAKPLQFSLYKDNVLGLKDNNVQIISHKDYVDLELLTPKSLQIKEEIYHIRKLKGKLGQNLITALIVVQNNRIILFSYYYDNNKTPISLNVRYRGKEIIMENENERFIVSSFNMLRSLQGKWVSENNILPFELASASCLGKGNVCSVSKLHVNYREVIENSLTGQKAGYDNSEDHLYIENLSSGTYDSFKKTLLTNIGNTKNIKKISDEEYKERINGIFGRNYLHITIDFSLLYENIIKYTYESKFQLINKPLQEKTSILTIDLKNGRNM